MHLRVHLNMVAFATLYSLTLSAQWNPYAGVITPFTAGATVITSSTGGASPSSVIDQNDNTNWQSGATLPTNYISRSDLNYFYSKNAWFSGTGTGINYAPASDGNVQTVVSIPHKNNKSLVQVSFPEAISPVCLSVKIGMGGGVYAIKAFVFSSPTDSVLIGEYVTANNYSTIRYNFPAGMLATHVKLHGLGGGFNLFEMACLAAPPREFVIVDFGTVRDIGYIETRHWAGGNATATVLYSSADGITWITLDSLNPNTVPRVPLVLPAMVQARYLKLEHTLNTVDYAKCLFWEIAAYDDNGWMGPKPTAQKSKLTIGEMTGVNSLWGWGYNGYSSATDNGKGPWMFNKVVSQARFYHSLDWDIVDPDATPDFEAMAAGAGTPAQFWLNWDTEYQAWVNAGLNVETSIQFTAQNFPPNVWNNPYQAAYNYGAAFADHFGRPSTNNFVKTLEIGNEPWDYPAPFYREVLRGMASGAKAADPDMEVFPGALQAAFPGNENGLFKNFTGVRLTEAEAPYLDGLNSHLYCFRNDENGIRRNINPEAPFSEFWSILADIRFRDANMPGKKIYVTEFGWDSPGGGDDCVHDECVSEKSQAIYGIRAALILSRLGIDRFHWYFYGDQYAGTLFARSGMHSLNFTPKRSFRAFQAMKDRIGDRYFLGIEREDDNAYIYKLGDADGTVTHYVAWRPVDGNIKTTRTVSFPSESAPVAAFTLGGVDANGEEQITPDYSDGMISAMISVIPLVIEVASNNGPSDSGQGFTGWHDNGNNQLKWVLPSDRNLKTVTLERSDDGIHFDQVHEVTNTKGGQFQYTDPKVPSGKLYYRLQLNDTQDRTEFSPTVIIKNAAKGSHIYPNPVRNQLYINGLPEDTPYWVVNSVGIVVRRGDVLAGSLDCSDLQEGVYYLRVGDWSEVFYKD